MVKEETKVLAVGTALGKDLVMATIMHLENKD